MSRWTAAFVLLLPSLALAQPGPGEIGVYADAEGTIDRIDFPAFVPFTLYVVAGPEAGIDWYQFQVDGLLEQGVVIVGASTPGVNDDFLEPNQFVVEASSCLTGDVVVLAEIQVVALAPLATDTAVCVGPVDGFEVAAFVDCSGEEQAFGTAQNGDGVYPDGCLIVNPSDEIFCCYTNIYELGMPEVLAAVGDVRRLPLVSDVWQDWYCVGSAVPRTTCLPGESYRIRRDLTFDPTLLRLVGAEVGVEVVGWTLTLTDVEPGRVTVDGLSPGQQDPWPDLDFGAHIWFEFEVLAPGTAQIVFGPDSTNPVFGAITQDPVRNEGSSFGALKARFGN